MTNKPFLHKNPLCQPGGAPPPPPGPTLTGALLIYVQLKRHASENSVNIRIYGWFRFYPDIRYINLNGHCDGC